MPLELRESSSLWALFQTDTQGRQDIEYKHRKNRDIADKCLAEYSQEANVIKGKREYIELANRQNGCFFTTKELKKLNEAHADLQATYEKKQSTLAKEVISIAGQSPLGSLC